MLTKSDQERIASAIAEAESKTSGEIFCVLTREVSRYREVPLLWGAFAGFVVPPLLVLPEGAAVTLLGQEVRGADRTWSQVRAGSGDVGWVAAEYLQD